MERSNVSRTQGDEMHLTHMRHALELANKVIPKPTNFCVGAVLVDESSDSIISTGFTNELPGNTHAEQCAISKMESETSFSEKRSLIIYTTMEPCNMRASGNTPCADRILEFNRNRYPTQIRSVFVGVQEPRKFVGTNKGRAKLEAAGLNYVHVAGLEEEILRVATSGHEQLQTES